MQVMFRDGKVPVEIAWVKMVLIPKGKGDYRDIGLVEVLWKVCAVVVSCWLKRSAVLHDTLRGFITGRGMRAATLEANLAHHLEGLVQELLFQIFLNI